MRGHEIAKTIAVVLPLVVELGERIADALHGADATPSVLREWVGLAGLWVRSLERVNRRGRIDGRRDRTLAYVSRELLAIEPAVRRAIGAPPRLVVIAGGVH